MKQFIAVAAVLCLAAHLSAASLERGIARELAASPTARTAFWGIQIVDLATGKTLFARNAGHLFIPASNTKLFTAALALDRLGPDFRFHTRVVADAAPDAEGRLHGDMRLIGGGDPNLSARTVPYQPGPVTGNPLAEIEELAAQVAAHGVTRVDGDIVGDDTWYTWEPYPGGWAIEDMRYDYGAPVSALTVNDNQLAVTLYPGTHAGELAAIALSPAVEYYIFDNRVQTGSPGSAVEVHLDREPGGRQVRLSGSIPLGSAGQILDLAIEDPAEYAARAFRQALEDRGVVVAGRALAHHRFPNAEAPPESEGVELARHDSEPLLEGLAIMAKVSQNLHAELVLRAVARERLGVGTRQAGLAEMQTFLTSAGIAPDSYSFADGSGLDRTGLVTPEAIIQLLSYMYASPKRDSWIALMPVGGVEGTLSERFPNAEVGRRIHAKTGTLSHVSALSGYAQRRDGSWVAFSILVNNFTGPSDAVRSVIDRFCTLIVR